MNSIKKTYLWACRGPLRYVLVVGLGAYGISLGLALTAFLAVRCHLYRFVGAEVAFFLSESAGLIFGLGMWMFLGRKVRKLIDATTPSGR